MLPVISLLLTGVGCVKNNAAVTTNKTASVVEDTYAPEIDPDQFSSTIDNPFLTLLIGTKFVYEGKTEDGVERVEIEILDETKTVMGVETRIYWDRVWLDDELIEDTRDYLAQDVTGNVWYFGEDVDNYEAGKIVDHDGSWLAGVDGAQPGKWMLTDPQVGETYRQEYYVGEAEDMADVISLTENVSVPAGDYTNCLQTYDYTPLEPDVKEYKYYCKDVAGLALEVGVDSNERIELISFTN